MKSNKVEILKNNPSLVYNKNNVYMGGNCRLKTLPAPYDSTQVIGAPLTKFIDVFQDSLLTTLPGMMFLGNNRLFIVKSALSTGIANDILLYNFDLVTGAHSYVGKISFAAIHVSTGAPTLTGFKVDDSDINNMKIFLTTRSSTPNLGGHYLINKVKVSDFVQVGAPVFYTAQSDDAAAVYNLQMPLENGGTHLLTTAAAVTVPGSACSDPSLNTKSFVHNGISATHQMYVFDYSIAPTFHSLPVQNVTANNTTGASTTFTMAGHGLSVGDVVIIKSGAPTGYVNSAPNAAQTFYFVVASNLTVNTFSLSLTFGGAILAATSATSATVFDRGIGISVNQFVAKTNNLPSLGAGTLLITNSENYCVPDHGALSGQDSVFMATTTNYYFGKLSDLFSNQSGSTTSASATISGLTSTSGLSIGQTVFGNGIPKNAVIASIVDLNTITISLVATVTGVSNLVFGAVLWPSLLGINVTGSTTDYVVPSPLQAAFGQATQVVTSLNTGNHFLTKKIVNGVLFSAFGNTGNMFYELQNRPTASMSIGAITQIENGGGWILASNASTTGQRGVFCFHLLSDDRHDYSYVVTQLLDTRRGKTLKSVKVIEQMTDLTAKGVVYYRTAELSTDALFNSPTGGWVKLSSLGELNVLLNNFTQFKISSLMTKDFTDPSSSVTSPLQLVDFVYNTSEETEISDYWDYSYADSSSDIPTKIGFALRKTYLSGAVPRMKLVIVEKSTGLVIGTPDTQDDSSNFTYSTDGGLNFNPLGTIPNTEDVRVVYTFTTPPGVDVRIAWLEY